MYWSIWDYSKINLKSVDLGQIGYELFEDKLMIFFQDFCKKELKFNIQGTVWLSFTITTITNVSQHDIIKNSFCLT